MMNVLRDWNDTDTAPKVAEYGPSRVGIGWTEIHICFNRSPSRRFRAVRSTRCFAFAEALMSWFHPAIATLALLACVTGGAASAQQPLYGFTAFPFELTAESEDNVHAIISKHANLFAIHMDQCLPWPDVTAARPYPDSLDQTRPPLTARIPPGQTVYLAMTPTDMDRQSMAPACGKAEDTPARHPKAISGKPFDDPAVIDAYVRYLRRNIDFFKPSYVNVGIEMSELSLRKPDG